MADTRNYGSGGNCVCPHCGAKVAHTSGVPCRKERCPDCGKAMVRENSYHHELINEKKAQKK